jgi:hypothetical protein
MMPGGDVDIMRTRGQARNNSWVRCPHSVDRRDGCPEWRMEA